ncbi:hypothetical protein C8R47DRAFT_1151334 [Mycena vitilis]|nr:hypothetical protein C8R47DRAFT_1151334 [Mycena vitilis]
MSRPCLRRSPSHHPLLAFFWILSGQDLLRDAFQHFVEEVKRSQRGYLPRPGGLKESPSFLVLPPHPHHSPCVRPTHGRRHSIGCGGSFTRIALVGAASEQSRLLRNSVNNRPPSYRLSV